MITENPEVEKRKTKQEQIEELEKEIAKTKYNKRTEKAIGLLKAKLAKLKEREEARGGKRPATHGYEIRRTGDGTAIIIGFPSVGKSTLLNSITNQESEVAPYAFTTLTVIPGLLKYKGAKIQILDVPGILQGAASGKGRGKEVLSVARSADLAIILIDANHPEHLPAIQKEIRETGLRLNEKKPDIKIVRKSKGGISVGTTIKMTKISRDTIKGILNEFRMVNADVVVRSDIDADQLIDVIEANKIYIPGITLINKIDTVTKERLEEIKKMTNADLLISAEKKIGLDELKEEIFEKMGFIEVYCKDPGKKADVQEPLIMKKGATIKDVCSKLHKDFVRRFKFARVWGESAKFPGQKLMMNHVLKDRDVVELHLT